MLPYAFLKCLKMLMGSLVSRRNDQTLINKMSAQAWEFGGWSNRSGLLSSPATAPVPVLRVFKFLKKAIIVLYHSLPAEAVCDPFRACSRHLGPERAVL